MNSEGITHPYTKTNYDAELSNESPLIHMTLEEGKEFISISFPGNTLIPSWIWYVYFGVIIVVSIVLSFGLSYMLDRFPCAKLPLLNASAIVAAMIIGCYVCGSLPYVDYTYFLLNWVILFAISLIINALSLPFVGNIIVPIFTLIWYIADSYVIKFRNKPIMPADLKALGTAREVVQGYEISLTLEMILGFILSVFYGYLSYKTWKDNKTDEKKTVKEQLIPRGINVAVAVVLLLISTHNPAFNSLNSFQWDAKVLEGFHREGIVLTYIKSFMSGHVSKPDGYSRDVVDSYLKDYEVQETPKGIQPRRIVMIMNEAFSDLRTVGLNPEIDVMPNIDSLNENTIDGSLYVSIIGGGTCNTEFEALTGNTLAFFGPGAYPYTENVTKPMFSLASYFDNYGYHTEAFHANKPNNWNRDTVYSNFGFNVFNTIEDYPSIEYLHNYVTDESDYEFIKKVDKETESEPRFLFNVTIQNHADYDHFLNLEEAETLKDYDDSLSQDARVYLSLIKVSDDSIGELLDYYSSTNEPTMVIFFGDHQPCLSSEGQKGVYTNVNVYQDYFKTKFFIWTNYETQQEDDVLISANYMPWLILERGNFPLPPYVQMLKELHEKYPVFTSQGVVDNEGNIYDDYELLLNDPLVRKYQHIQYANVFDSIDEKWFEIKK